MVIYYYWCAQYVNVYKQRTIMKRPLHREVDLKEINIYTAIFIVIKWSYPAGFTNMCDLL